MHKHVHLPLQSESKFPMSFVTAEQVSSSNEHIRENTAVYMKQKGKKGEHCTPANEFYLVNVMRMSRVCSLQWFFDIIYLFQVNIFKNNTI